jgi:hypothetical protein
MINGRNLFLYQFTEKVTKLTVIIIVGYQLHATFYPISSQGYVRTLKNLLGIINVGSDIIDQLLVGFSAFVIY